MAVYFTTSRGSVLLQELNQAIKKNHASGGITTWEHVEQDGQHFYTHTAPNWKHKAWFKATVETNRLAFNIVQARNVALTRLTYAYYGGHLIETFVRHFPNIFDAAQMTPTAVGGDGSF